MTYLLRIPGRQVFDSLGQPILTKISAGELNKKFEREYASR
jgi:hypothetical protein